MTLFDIAYTWHKLIKICAAQTFQQKNYKDAHTSFNFNCSELLTKLTDVFIRLKIA